MGPIQANATDHNPNGLPMNIGGTYSRVIGASLARAWENVLDWEHLPHLHSSSFSSLTLEDTGSWGWRARTVGQPAVKAAESLIELVVDRDEGHYVSRTLSGGIPGMEIWTRLTQVADRQTQVEVEFHIPNTTPEDAEKLGRYMSKLYTTLWDEDEQMMVERQTALDSRSNHHCSSGTDALNLGPADKVAAQLPLCITLEGKPVKIVELAGSLTAFHAECPHMLSPLESVEIDEAGCITCPWHGYKFDVSTGDSTDGHNLSLDTKFTFLTDESGNLMISAAHNAANR